MAPWRRLAMRSPALRATRNVPRKSMLISRSQLSMRTRSTACILPKMPAAFDKAGHRTMGGFDSGDAADDGALACDVQRVRPQDRLRARQGFGCDICDHDTPALLREQDRGRGADAAAAAGHENNAFGGTECFSP